MSSQELSECRFTIEAAAVLACLYSEGRLSAGGYDRVVVAARTFADRRNAEEINRDDVDRALELTGVEHG